MGKIDNFGDRRQVGQTAENRGGAFRAGADPRRNAGGKPSLHNDLKRAAMIGVPPEVQETIKAWFEEAAAKLADLGPDGFIAGLRGALDDACKRVLPVDAAEARAMWWRTILPIAFAGPCGPKDSNWTYASQEVGVRLLGKPKETIALEGAEAPAIDWSRVPEEERAELLAAITKLQGYVSTPSATEH